MKSLLFLILGRRIVGAEKIIGGCTGALVTTGSSLGSGGFTRKSIESFDFTGDMATLGLNMADAGGVMSAAQVGDEGALNTIKTLAWALQ
ncbi:unnamed protein product [Phytophthora fragariaefolia]|uniref:Unnamed protein product n=1 Tax=Phytophthora fragariaefolia TaxID=1490495 RepID=A0A9W7CVC5_9STRA|nr:unnamed protein product [Phytophthora fragariaefolia]